MLRMRPNLGPKIVYEGGLNEKGKAADTRRLPIARARPR